MDFNELNIGLNPNQLSSMKKVAQGKVNEFFDNNPSAKDKSPIEMLMLFSTLGSDNKAYYVISGTAHRFIEGHHEFELEAVEPLYTDNQVEFHRYKIETISGRLHRMN